MFTKLPWWVEIGGFWLALIAGAANAVGLMGFQHQAVSHVTGTSTLLGLSLVNGDGAGGLHLLLTLLSFVIGAALGGLLVGDTALRLSHRYSVALLLEAAVLAAAALTLASGMTVGHFLASAACGLQNGLVSTYSGAVIRTTHVTGLFTDLGTMIGQRLRGRPFDRRKALLYLLLITGFVLGGSGGAYGFQHLRFVALLLPAGGAAGLAIVYWAYQSRLTGTPASAGTRP